MKNFFVWPQNPLSTKIIFYLTHHPPAFWCKITFCQIPPPLHVMHSFLVVNPWCEQVKVLKIGRYYYSSSSSSSSSKFTIYWYQTPVIAMYCLNFHISHNSVVVTTFHTCHMFHIWITIYPSSLPVSLMSRLSYNQRHCKWCTGIPDIRHTTLTSVVYIMSSSTSPQKSLWLPQKVRHLPNNYIAWQKQFGGDSSRIWKNTVIQMGFCLYTPGLFVNQPYFLFCFNLICFEFNTHYSLHYCSRVSTETHQVPNII